MRPSKYSPLERVEAADRVRDQLLRGVSTGPNLRRVIGWNEDDALRLLWALVAVGDIVRSDTSKPWIYYALPVDAHLLQKPKRLQRQTWASAVMELAA